MENKIQELTNIIKNSKNIVFFGGAGVSTESGIPDFRSADGLYSSKYDRKFSPEEILSHNFFYSHTNDFYKFYKDKMIYTKAKPNPAHIVLAQLEKMDKLKAIITQNIDGLHQMAGSKNVFELHGSVYRNYCTNCYRSYDLDYIIKSKDIPKCESCGGTIKPDVVLYGEALDNNVINGALNAIKNADTLIIGGTSLVVYPAAGFVDYFRGKNLILINKSSTQYDNKANLVINDSIGKVLKSVFDKL
ncbi:NAD-dependent protein deacylase [Clostridium sp.]|uniref:NAD-dependent protein deacylase n=1 Tax=Clostridium sp. TaxID=1506 RepID=UPI0026DD5ECC|nr:NAD-dependent protein deacylase [Clostridium sp.]MDO5039829.1 NAD-dependent protein deacylase [Clostridium sp.]